MPTAEGPLENTIEKHEELDGWWVTGAVVLGWISTAKYICHENLSRKLVSLG